MKSPYEQAMTKADEWRANALKNLDASSADYETYKEQIALVYDDMVKKADETALNSSKSLEDGFKRGFRNIQDEIGDLPAWLKMRLKTLFPVWKTLLRVLSLQENKFFRFCRCGCQRFVPHCHQAGHNPAFDGRNRQLFWIFHSS